LNRGPSDYESPALTAELRAQLIYHQRFRCALKTNSRHSDTAICVGFHERQFKEPQTFTVVKSLAVVIVRFVPSGIYFARAKVGSKLIRTLLKTDRLSVAQLRLGDLMKKERGQLESRAEAGKGRMIFAAALDIYQKRLHSDVTLKPSVKIYHEKMH
jgi:hypothetical protein